MSLSQEVSDSERGVFSFHGIIGYAIAVVLLLSILTGLSIWGLNVQQSQATNTYQIDSIHNVEMISNENYKSAIVNQ